MTSADWLACWDELRRRINSDRTSWGRNQITELMDEIERAEVGKEVTRVQAKLDNLQEASK